MRQRKVELDGRDRLKRGAEKEPYREERRMGNIFILVSV